MAWFHSQRLEKHPPERVKPSVSADEFSNPAHADLKGGLKIPVLQFLVNIVYTFWRLLPALELRLRTFEGADGEIVTYLPKTNLLTLLPGRIAGPALHSSAEGSQVSGLHPDLGVQDRTLDRHQTIRLAATLPPGKASASTIKKAGFPEAGNNPEAPAFQVIERGELPPMLDAGTMAYLEAEWRDSND